MSTKIRVGEAARILACSPERIRQLADTGRIPCERMPWGRVFDRAEVEAFAARRRERMAGAGR